MSAKQSGGLAEFFTGEWRSLVRAVRSWLSDASEWDAELRYWMWWQSFRSHHIQFLLRLISHTSTVSNRFQVCLCAPLCTLWFKFFADT